LTQIAFREAPPMKTAIPAPQPAPRRGKRPQHQLIDLALQGGGSHGAFTWGVLDRLLEDERLEIAGISGTSAGAMNAVALAAGLMEGGRHGARAALRRFWTRVAQASPFHALQSGPWGELFGPDNPWLAPMQMYAQWLGQLVSPYQLNPLNLNPLRDILQTEIDFDRVRQCSKTRLFIAATQVSSGRLRVFEQSELTADMVLGSACLPLLFQAVEIGGEAYWDGGYAGNPSLLPLVTDTVSDDLLLVPINPSRRETVPTQARDILDRVNEITFNASLLKELRSIALLKQLIQDEGRPRGASRTPRQPLYDRIAALRVHRLDAEGELSKFGASTKLDTRWSFLQQLHGIGRRTADDWLRLNFEHLGRRSTVDLTQEFLAPT
jgi:NTE family protein